jgi:RNA polymerase sigma-70 factor (ECF subfamily)
MEFQVAQSQKAARSLGLVDRRAGKQDLATVIKLIGQGDKFALALLYDATGGLLFGLLLLTLGDTATADSVLTDVYEDVRQRAVRFDRQSERPLTWLITIAHRQALKHLLSGKSSRYSVICRDRQRLATDFSEDERLVCATLGSLSPAQQNMIELAFFSGMSPRDIAVKIEQPAESVKSGLQYGMLQLYNLFKNPQTVAR